MKVVVTGGAGYVGRAVVDELADAGHQVTVIDRRIVVKRPGVAFYEIDLLADEIDPRWFERADAVIHLAGAPLFGRYWTARYRRELYDSRVETARRIIAAIDELPASDRPKIVVSANAIGYYGDRGDEIMTESSVEGTGYLAKLCRDWQAVWRPLESAGVRYVSVRTGIVISELGGIMSRLRPLATVGFGVVPGRGRQWISWVGLGDLVSIYRFALDTPTLSGAVNAVAPQPLHYQDFARQVTRYYSRPHMLAVPAWMIRLVLGRASAVLLDSARVKPVQLLDRGFVFRATTIRQALDK